MPRVLLVDDSPAKRAVLAARLEAAGWQVSFATDAEGALMSALSSPPDAVLSDLWTPGLSGLQLCQLLRGDPATAHVPVMLCTNTADRRSRFWAKRSGANAFLERDDPESIVRELQTLVVTVALARRSDSSMEFDPSLRRSTIPGRLSTLLDRALFEAVVVGELRALAFDAADVDDLFASLARLMTEIASYTWLALSVPRPRGVRVYVHQHPRHAGRAIPGAVPSVVSPSDGPVELHVRSGTAVSSEPPDGPVSAFPITLRGRLLGRVALCASRSSLSRDEPVVMSLAARELALPLHAVGLLEDTRRLASTDALTGLANRRAAVARLAALTERSGTSPPLSIALVDVDLFKRVNDTCGHAAGDRALCHVADVLRAVARGNDLMARWGGEEFLLVLDGLAGTAAQVVAERVRASIARTPCVLDDGRSLPMTVSVGVAAFQGGSVDAFLDTADRALYRAKQAGRNRVELADADGPVTPPAGT